MTLVLFGGISGVGKTTLISILKGRFGSRIRLINPGELFRRYFYHKKVKTIAEIEELIVSKLTRMPRDSIVVVHWHYAVRRPSGYISQIKFSRLERIAKSGKVDKVVLLLVEAPAKVVRKRRSKDCKIKKRSVSMAAICEEMRANEKFLAKHNALLSKILGKHNVEILRLSNIDLRTARLALNVFFKKLVER